MMAALFSRSYGNVAFYFVKITIEFFTVYTKLAEMALLVSKI